MKKSIKMALLGLMIKRLFLVAVLLLCFSDAFSQVQPFSVKFRKGEKSENVVKPEFKTRQQRFDELNRGEGIMKTAIERRFIKKGDSVRIKFSFDPRAFTRIEVEDAQPSTMKDIVNGEYIAVVRPEKTKIIQVKMVISEDFGGGELPGGNRTIVVLDEDEFAKLDAKLNEYEANKDEAGISKINAKLNEYIKAAGIDQTKVNR